MTKLSAHSEVGLIKSVLIKRPDEGFVDQGFVDQEWESLNFLGAPNLEKAKSEHKNLEELIAVKSPEIHYLPKSGLVTLDSVYCRDASIVTDFGIILCEMGKDKRKSEPEEEQRFFENNNVKILGQIESPGTLEGGDVAWLDQQTLAVGHTYRTNYEGIRQLKNLLAPVGVELLVAEMPHYQGPSDVFHLMSVLSPVDFKKAVVYSPLMPIHFRNELLARDFEFIEVPDEEFESMASNVLATAPSECIMVSGNPITKSRLEAAGCTVHEYQGEEISVKGGGGPTCLTRPILREI
ncbi:MAG: arginine deiminase family protein [Cyclobacteriaceae bacterium]